MATSSKNKAINAKIAAQNAATAAKNAARKSSSSYSAPKVTTPLITQPKPIAPVVPKSLQDYSIAASQGTLIDPKTYLTQQQIQGGYSTIPGQFNAVTGKPNSMTTESLVTEQPITLPTPTATDTEAAAILTAQQELETARKALEAQYKAENDRLKKEAETAQKKIDEYNAANQGILENDVKPLTAPFQQTLETSERNRLQVEKNYFDNQKLTDELDGLLTEGNNLVAQMKGVTGLENIRNPRINQAIEGVNARVGVIQAVMSARNGQIAQAYNLINRSVDAITSDRRDQISYYNSLINFNDTLKDDEGKKLVTLSARQKEILNAQIGLLESDVQRTQANADYIKGLMTNPATAATMARAGVTLNMTPEQVNQALAEDAYNEEVRDNANDLELKGYQTLTPEQMAGKSEDELIRYTDSRGNEQVFWKQPDMAEADIRSVDGGLYDVTNRSWIVRPNSGGGSGSGGSGGGVLGFSSEPAYVPGTDPTVDAWIKRINEGTAKLEDIKEADEDRHPGLRNAVNIALANNENPRINEIDLQLSLINDILLSPFLSQVTGAINPLTYWTPGSNEQYVKAQFAQLKANLALENRQKLKGQGTISDREMKILTEASTALQANLSDVDAKKEIVKIQDVFTAAKQRLTGQVGLSEDQARQIIVDYGNNNPDDRALILDLVTNNDPVLGRPMTYAEVQQYLQETGKLK